MWELGWLGKRIRSPGRPQGVVATGAIDEVRFYTRVPAPAEIAALAAPK